MFASKVETIAILLGLAVLAAIVVTLIYQPAITVIIGTVLSWLYVGFLLRLCLTGGHIFKVR